MTSYVILSHVINEALESLTSNRCHQIRIIIISSSVNHERRLTTNFHEAKPFSRHGNVIWTDNLQCEGWTWLNNARHTLFIPLIIWNNITFCMRYSKSIMQVWNGNDAFSSSPLNSEVLYYKLYKLRTIDLFINFPFTESANNFVDKQPA